MQKIEHIGIAVSNLEEAEKKYELLTGSPSYKREAVESQGVMTSFFRMGPNKIELLADIEPNGIIDRFIEKRGEGIHHIAYAVVDILAEMKRLSSEGFQLLNEEPISGADNKLICFVHPKSNNGVLTELCQERRDD